MRVLITGICGFIGHHVAEHIIINTDWQVVGIDKLSYASNGFNRLRDTGCLDKIELFATDFSQPLSVGLIQELGDIDYIIHLGAETHVDNSIADPMAFVMANVVGTCNMLNYARRLKNLKRFIYFSTDEVFGPAIGDWRYKEWDRYCSGNPYSATKAGGEELCLAFANTYRMPILITHCMNAFGERQHPEKFIPSTIQKILRGDLVSIHADPTRTVAGSRSYIHCRNIAAAVMFLIEQGENSDKYNIVGEKEVDNLTLAQLCAKVIDKPLNYEMVDFHSNIPGHDLRYALDGDKLYDMGFSLPKTFEQSLEKTIKWYIENPKWLEWANDQAI